MSQLSMEIKELDIIPDHVHMFIKTQPIQSSQFVIGQLKGSGNRLLRQEFSSLKSREPNGQDRITLIVWKNLMTIQLRSLSKITKTNKRFHPNVQAQGFFAQLS